MKELSCPHGRASWSRPCLSDWRSQGVGADLRVAPEEHCVVFVVDQEPDGKLITTDPVCFPSQNETDAYGRTWLRSVSPAAVSPVRRTGLALASFTLGTHYDGANGTGSSISVVGSSCTGGYWNTPSNWDNRISSSFNGCARLRHWDLPSMVGSVQDTYGAGSTHNLSSMDNKTQSVSYHSS